MELVTIHRLTLDVFPHTLRQLGDGGYSVEVFADEDQMRSLIEAKAVEPRALRASGYGLNSALRATHGKGAPNLGEPKHP